MQNIKSDSKALRCVALIGLMALLIVYTLSTVARFSISPEIGMAYVTFENVNNLFEVLHKFIVFNEVWYRPFTFYLTNYAFFNLINIHNIYLFKSIALAMILLNGYVVTVLAKTLFKSSWIERIIIFSLVITHPLYYAIGYEGSGVVDPVFNIFLNLFVIVFLGLVTRTQNYRMIPVILCGIFMLGAITSQERGLAVFPMMGGLTLYYYLPQIVSGRFRLNKSIAAVLAIGGMIFLSYLYFVYGSKQTWSGPEYRTGVEFAYILPNLVKGIELPLRFLFFNMNKGYDIHKEWIFNLFALPFTISFIAYLISVFIHKNTEEKSRLIVLAILFVSALILPVLFGGNVWHFYTAALYASIAMGRALWFWCQKVKTSMQILLLAVFFLWLAVATIRGIHQELDETGLGNFMALVPEALIDKTLQSSSFVPEVVYYDTGGYGDFTWPFGGKGNLFKFLYKNPAIIEIAVSHGKVLESDRPLCANVSGKKALYYGFDVGNLSWHKIQEKDYCA